MFNNLFENEENFETYEEYYKPEGKVVKVRKTKTSVAKVAYIKKDNPKKKHAKDMRSARKFKVIRQGRR